MTIIRMEVEHI